jgi:hypothetical protein
MLGLMKRSTHDRWASNQLASSSRAYWDLDKHYRRMFTDLHRANDELQRTVEALQRRNKDLEARSVD